MATWGIDPATLRVPVMYLNHYATGCPCPGSEDGDNEKVWIRQNGMFLLVETPVWSQASLQTWQMCGRWGEVDPQVDHLRFLKKYSSKRMCWCFSSAPPLVGDRWGTVEAHGGGGGLVHSGPREPEPQVDTPSGNFPFLFFGSQMPRAAWDLAWKSFPGRAWGISCQIYSLPCQRKHQIPGSVGWDLHSRLTLSMALQMLTLLLILYCFSVWCTI